MLNKIIVPPLNFYTYMPESNSHKHIEVWDPVWYELIVTHHSKMYSNFEYSEETYTKVKTNHSETLFLKLPKLSQPPQWQRKKSKSGDCFKY